MPEVRIITTEDGSHSLYVEALNETYHSFHGALQESRHVFIRMGWQYVIGDLPNQPIRLLEVGFGTGLNALLTVQAALADTRQVYYHTLEPYPLTESIYHQLNYGEKLGEGHWQDSFLELHQATWEQPVVIGESFTLLKSQKKLEEISLGASQYHLVYFDAFAPNKQGELWELAMLEKVANSMAPGGIFVTYCAKGKLKRDLKEVGLEVETLPGPPGKKEMVRALKPA
jgi:tRNA U34 5-methylaminomethyl-2-thiouridine-forming methyltransferase MnmC